MNKDFVQTSLYKLMFVFFLLGCGLFPKTVDALSISPSKQTFVLDKSIEQSIQIDVFNDSNEAVHILTEVEAFRVDSKIGIPTFNTNDIATGWVSGVGEEYIIPPRETKRVDFFVTVPSDAIPGSHYMAFFVKEVSSGSGQISIGSRLGSLIFLHVAGEVEESLVREYFSSSKDVYMFGDVELFLQLKNTGDIDVVPRGKLIVTDWRDKKIYEEEINSKSRLVLPDGRWREDYRLSGDLLWKYIGPLNVQIVLGYGQTNQSIVDLQRVWYVPFWAVGGIIGMIILFVVSIVFLRRKIATSNPPNGR